MYSSPERANQLLLGTKGFQNRDEHVRSTFVFTPYRKFILALNTNFFILIS